jgi:hypothetical protein
MLLVLAACRRTAWQCRLLVVTYELKYEGYFRSSKIKEGSKYKEQILGEKKNYFGDKFIYFKLHFKTFGGHSSPPCTWFRKGGGVMPTDCSIIKNLERDSRRWRRFASA